MDAYSKGFRDGVLSCVQVLKRLQSIEIYTDMEFYKDHVESQYCVCNKCIPENQLSEKGDS